MAPLTVAEEAPLARPFDEACDKFKARLDELIGSYQTPPDRRIGYGNLRHSYSSWESGGECCTNIAVIYETPGGSTTQLNYSFDHNTGEFSFLDHDLETPRETADPEQVFNHINEHIATITEKRLTQVRAVVDAWLNEGKDTGQVFAEFNKLLQSEFLGGRINTAELKAGIQHVVARVKAGKAVPQA
jgi:hypothetical protein